MQDAQTHSAPEGVAMFATGWCPYCVKAEAYLKSKGVSNLKKILVDQEQGERERMLALSGGRRSVPQIFIAGVHVGGCDDLIALGSAKPHELAALLERAGALG